MACKKIKPSKLLIVAWNAAGLTAKLQEIKEFISRYQPDILCISETHAKAGHRTRVPNYTEYRNDRLDGPMGGTSIYIKRNIQHHRVLTPGGLQIEATIVTIITNQGNIRVISAYKKPNNRITDHDLDALFDTDDKIILAGDLNCKHPDWNSRIANTNGNALKTILDNRNCMIYAPTEPTHYHGATNSWDVLDVVIVKNLVLTKLPRAIPDLSSDHYPITFQWGDGSTLLKITKYRTNWKKYQDDLQNSEDLRRAVAEADNLTTEELTELTQSTIRTMYDSNTISYEKNARYEYIPDSIRQLIRARRAAIKKFQRTLDPVDAREKNRLQFIVKRELDKYYNNSWEKKLQEMENVDFWKIPRIFKRRKGIIDSLIEGDRIANSPMEKVELFAECLEDQFTNNNEHEAQHDRIVNYYNISKYNALHEDIRPTTKEEITFICKNLNKRKAPGNDGITNLMLRNLPDVAINAVVKITNKVLETGTFPAIWKTADVVMIPKPGKPKNDPKSYRPISLLPMLSKVVERVILIRLTEDCDDKRILPDEQFGFREQLSTDLQLLRITETIHQAIDRKHFCIGVFLDIEKAFDKVWHEGLLSKLCQFGINQKLTSIIESFLQARSYQVKLGNITSEARRIRSGVPQGAVLSPMLYNLYTADVPKCARTDMFVYADDIAIIAHACSTITAQNRIQQHLRRLEDYFVTWKLTPNATKSEAIQFTTRRTVHNPELTLRGEVIPIVPKVKYLGVYLDRKMTWRDQAAYLRQKGVIIIKTLYPMIHRGSRLNIKNKTTLFKQMLRPAISYGSVAWGTAARCHLRHIQVIENKFLRLITDAPWDMSCRIIRDELQLDTAVQHIREINIKRLNHVIEHDNILIRRALQYDPIPRTRRNRPLTMLIADPP